MARAAQPEETAPLLIIFGVRFRRTSDELPGLPRVVAHACVS